MSKFSKFKNAKKVTFKKDFGLHYKAGSVHIIHNKTVLAKNLKAFGKVEDIDFEELHRKVAKAKKENAKKEIQK
jgi:uncharacterized membrane protein YcaP (DUF421 family)